MTAVPLDERIVAALSGPCTSAQAETVLSDATAALTDMTAQADAADVASLNPLATATEARKLRQQGADLRFEADRLDASVSALRCRVSELADDEAEARRRTVRNATLKVRDELAADIARDYPRIVSELAALAKRCVESEAECKRIGITETAEQLGRGYHGWQGPSGPILFIPNIALQMADGTTAWTQNNMTGQYVWAALAEKA